MDVKIGDIIPEDEVQQMPGLVAELETLFQKIKDKFKELDSRLKIMQLNVDNSLERHLQLQHELAKIERIDDIETDMRILEQKLQNEVQVALEEVRLDVADRVDTVQEQLNQIHEHQYKKNDQDDHLFEKFENWSLQENDTQEAKEEVLEEVEYWNNILKQIETAEKDKDIPENIAGRLKEYCHAKMNEQDVEEEESDTCQQYLNVYIFGMTTLMIMDSRQPSPFQMIWHMLITFLITIFSKPKNSSTLMMEQGLPKFDGVTSSFTTWFREFELHLSRYPMVLTTQMKISKMRAFLEREPQMYLDELDNATKMDMDLVRQAFELQYPADVIKQLATMSLDEYEQKEGESVSEFANRLTKLTFEIHEGKTRNQILEILKEEFIRRLVPSLRAKIRTKNPATFYDALKIAQKKEIEQNQGKAVKQTQMFFAEKNLQKTPL